MLRLLRLLEDTMSQKALIAAVGLTATLWAPLLVAADAERCAISPDVLRPYAAPAATHADFAASRRAFYGRQSTACAATAWSAAEKDVLYEWLAKEMSLDWQSTFTDWQRRGAKVDERSSEAVAHFQRDLLETIDAVTTPAEIAHREAILRYAGGAAIAKLGPAVHDDVLASAQRPALLAGLGRKHDPREEAVRAIGYWLDPANEAFRADQKRQMARVLTGLLSADGSVKSGEYKATVTILWALGRSDSADVERELSAWRHLNASHGGHLAAEAEQAIEAVRQRIQASAMPPRP
jgi:hypothetical protein